MKQLVTPANVTFNAAGKTLTFATTIPSTISHILHVTNVTTGTLMFQPQAGALFTGTYASPVLTLACSTSGMANADKLEIFYDDGIGAASEAKQDATITSLGTDITTPTAMPAGGVGIRGWLSAIWTKLNTSVPVTGTFWQATQPVSMAAVPTGAATENTLVTLATQTTSAAILAKIIAAPATEAKQDTTITNLGIVTETAPATDTASSGLNGRLQRVAQRLTSLIALLPSSLGIKTAANSFSIAPASDSQFRLGDGTNVVSVSTTVGDATLDAQNRLRVEASIAGYNGSTWQSLRAGITGIFTSRVGHLNVLTSLIYRAAGTTLSDGDCSQPTADTAGNMKVVALGLPASLGIKTAANSTSVAPASDAVFIPAIGAELSALRASSSAYEASRVVKASAGTLLSIIGYNSKASAQFIQLHNTTTVVADTAVPILTITVPATSNFSVDVPVSGIPFTTGIMVCNSSTGPTKTVGSADCFFTAVYK